MITATSKGKNYHTEITNGKHVIWSDTPVADGGSDEYQRPGDILASSLAACMNITARKIMDKKGLEYREVKTYIDLDRSNPDKFVFKTKMVIDADFADEIKAEITETVKRCPVCNILAGEKEFVTME